MDTLTPAQRSACMSRVRSKDTKPEMIVRRLLHGRGFRYRLHDKRLPGKPDLTFAGRRKVIFVHGCFWHMHEGCSHAGIPKSRLDFWKSKLEHNRSRDQMNVALLEKMGWRVLVVWECELRDMNAVTTKLENFLNKE
ncbi:MAG: very short patch repair endonuclease [Rhodoferax sp.]|uniref:very short patch repair endonuclease n=1 Tax=Rhodoferax sp. TaxID=50421 RepID=UPI002635C27F|nr:very short patch repair endonuclease [Rhodoferax sp.]MDD2878812.1 very short patch repair endonuclease [Rhodoferax sp.]